MIKTLNEQGIEGNYLKIIKGRYKKSHNTINITLNNEKLKAFLLTSRTRKIHPLTAFLEHRQYWTY